MQGRNGSSQARLITLLQKYAKSKKLAADMSLIEVMQDFMQLARSSAAPLTENQVFKELNLYLSTLLGKTNCMPTSMTASGSAEDEILMCHYTNEKYYPLFHENLKTLKDTLESMSDDHFAEFITDHIMFAIDNNKMNFAVLRQWPPAQLVILLAMRPTSHEEIDQLCIDLKVENMYAYYKQYLETHHKPKAQRESVSESQDIFAELTQDNSEKENITSPRC